jgi:hypothetical protein
MAQPNVVEETESSKPPAYFCDALNDAERLLKYAAEIGIEVDPDTRASILHARAAYPNGWTEDVAASLLASLTKLAADLKPVTAASLKAYYTDTRPTVHTYLVWSIILACVILPVSVATFVTSAISTALSADITKANAFAVKLRAELGPPPSPGDPPWTAPKGVSETDVIADLQDYAATVRVINARARKLNRFVLPREIPPAEDTGTTEQRKSRFELPVGIPDPVAARDTITSTYQDVRYFALTLLTDVSVFYGAISTCILPVLYALLGTCAYLLRTFEHQMSNRTFTPSAANSARFLIAAIGGAVVGLFNNFTVTEQASIPPLAIAFLVGYAVDVFFAFLEGLLTVFTKTGHPSATSKP